METKKTLMEKLALLMPKKPEPPQDGRMMRFDPEPIRRAAESFAHALNFDLPENQEELIALLWVFGEFIDGEMQKRERYYRDLVDKALASTIAPLTITSAQCAILKEN